MSQNRNTDKIGFGVNTTIEVKEQLDKLSTALNLSRSQTITNIVSALKSNDSEMIDIFKKILNK